jgi:amphi-Trp domain-containing protein
MKWKEKKHMKKDGVARLLREFSEGMAGEGKVEFEGHQAVFANELEVEIEYKEKHDKSKFEIELKWKHTGGSSPAVAVLFSETPHPVVKVATIEELSPGKAISFAYPTSRDEAVLIVLPNGGMRAYSTVCPHKGKHVTWNPKTQKLYCPSHKALFNPEDGRGIGKHSRERLRKIHVQIRGDEVFAVGIR